MNKLESIHANNAKERFSGNYADKITNLLDDIIEDKNFTDFNIERVNVLQKEENLKKLSKYEEGLNRLLNLYGIKDVPVRKIAHNLFSISITKNKNFDKLEEGYAYKGGAARDILEQELKITTSSSVRDIDLLKIVDDENEDKDRVMAEKYCPEDLENGHGVEKLEKEYFETRDFTINELLVSGNQIFLTKECLLDTARGIIRFSDYEKKELFNNYDDYLEKDEKELVLKGDEKPSYFERYKDEKNNINSKFFVNDKLMAKALRFSALQSTKRREITIADENVYKYLDINNFHIALHLDRALEQGIEVAEKYIEELILYKQLPPMKEKSPRQILLDVIKMLKEDGSFVFRSEAETILKEESLFLEDYDKKIDKYHNLLKQSAKTRHIKDVLSEL